MNKDGKGGFTRLFPLLLALASSSLILATVWQTGRYAQLAAESKRLESEQRAWIEENRKLAAGISVLTSRARADELARALGLEKAKPGQRIGIEKSAKSGGSGG